MNANQQETTHMLWPNYSCGQIAQRGSVHPLQQQQQQQVGQVAATWQQPADCAAAAVPGSGYGAQTSMHCNVMHGAASYEPYTCDMAAGSLDGLADAGLEALIERELRAAAATAALDGGAAEGGYAANCSGKQMMMPAALLPTGAGTTAVDAPAANAAAAAAQNAKLQALVAEYNELSAALQQLQQMAGMLHRVDSGSISASYSLF
jgi:hypothetical protein